MKYTIPLNYSDTFKQTGVHCGKIAKRLGKWSVDNCPDASIAIFDPPYQEGDMTSAGKVKSVIIEKDFWVLEVE